MVPSPKVPSVSLGTLEQSHDPPKHNGWSELDVVSISRMSAFDPQYANPLYSDGFVHDLYRTRCVLFLELSYSESEGSRQDHCDQIVAKPIAIR